MGVKQESNSTLGQSQAGVTNRHTQYTQEWTPWGRSDSRTHYGDGVTFYSTSSHGGFKLSEERLREITSKLGVVETFCGYPQWFEEDCDWTYVALAFPELFTGDELAAANTYREYAKRKASLL